MIGYLPAKFRFLPFALGAVMLCSSALHAEGDLAATLDLPEDIWAVGTAWTEDGSAVQYYEFHFADEPGLDLPTRVEYRTPEGELFAEKTIDYSASLTAPAIRQIDYRFDARVTTEHPETSGARLINVGFQAHDSRELRESALTVSDSLIVDAGFDPFIRQNWQPLTDGRRITSDFLVPARLDSVRIGITRTRESDCRIDVEVVCFVIRPAGLLRVVGWLVDPIYIGYHPDTQRLAVFNGLSNLRDDAGEPRNAQIIFEYF